MMTSDTSNLQNLKDKLLTNRKNIAFNEDKKYLDEVNCFSDEYKNFLNSSKTEREIVQNVKKMAISVGFKEFDSSLNYKSGDKIFKINREKNIVLVIVGDDGAKNGINLVASHIDSPRIDIRPNPLFESNDLGFLKTHYYGGIKKYQWTALPLALHGKFIKNNGEELSVAIGENDDDCCFCITDLLPHLASEQMSQPMNKCIKGEDLNLLVGSIPFEDSKNSKTIKLALMNLLYEKYGICEDDFAFAELELVPAIKAKDVGFDKSMIGAYGHDDRCCSFASLKAFLEISNCKKTSILALIDKEEIGSEGNTGAKSEFLKQFLKELIDKNKIKLRDIIQYSKCISADVDAAYDPNYSDKFDSQNSARLNYGVVLTKYTGIGGKAGASDASVEYLGYIRKILKENNIAWQTGLLGKVDTGGGGTVAKFFAQLNLDVVDIGIPVLSMHSPFEVISKFDIYEYFKMIKAFIKSY